MLIHVKLKVSEMHDISAVKIRKEVGHDDVAIGLPDLEGTLTGVAAEQHGGIDHWVREVVMIEMVRGEKLSRGLGTMSQGEKERLILSPFGDRLL